jgi:hypothetical protein
MQPAPVLSRRNRVRRKSLYWNRRTAPAFSYLREIRTENEGLVDQNSGSWNRIAGWLRLVDLIRLAA